MRLCFHKAASFTSSQPDYLVELSWGVDGCVEPGPHLGQVGIKGYDAEEGALPVLQGCLWVCEREHSSGVKGVKGLKLHEYIHFQA